MLNDFQLERFDRLFQEKIKPAIMQDVDAFNELAERAEVFLKTKESERKEIEAKEE